MRSPKCPQAVKPYSHTFSFYVTLGSLSALLWVLASITNGAGLPSLPKFVTFREMKNIAFSYNMYTPLKPRQSREQPVSFQSAQDIVDALKAVTARAAGNGPAVVFGEEEEEQWHRENPCRSRKELALKYASRKIAQDVAPNAIWEEVFSEYMKMHRTCMSRVDNLDDYFLSRNTSTGCKFLVTECPKVGLGNKILFKSSSLLVAVLTQRVLLMPDKLNITDLFCEPFVGSSWRVNTFSEIRSKHSSWQSSSDFQLWVDKTEYRNRTDTEDLYAVDFSRPYQPLFRYYCNTEQAYMSKVPWVTFGGCLYFLPKIFSIPAFRPALEEMFPDRMALTHILRSAFLPSDPIWERVDNVNELYLRHTRSLIGVQLRYFKSKSHYRKMNDVINKRTLECAIKNELLPEALPLGEVPGNGYSGRHPLNTSKVFIASLFPGLHDYLSEIYVRQMTASGDGVGVVQLTHESEQHFGTEVDVEAFVEILCLSLSDALFVTPISTFGGVAEAYGALRPWFINFDEDDKGPACERAQSVDVCFDQASDRYICPHDPEFHGLSIIDSVSYMQKCLRRDSSGMQLITTHESNPSSSFHPADENYSLSR